MVCYTSSAVESPRAAFKNQGPGMQGSPIIYPKNRCSCCARAVLCALTVLVAGRAGAQTSKTGAGPAFRSNHTCGCPVLVALFATGRGSRLGCTRKLRGDQNPHPPAQNAGRVGQPSHLPKCCHAAPTPEIRAAIRPQCYTPRGFAILLRPSRNRVETTDSETRGSPLASEKIAGLVRASRSSFC